MKKLAVIIITSLCLSACSVMDKQDCRLANWHNLGFNDGLEGKSDQFFVTRSKACSKHGIASDDKNYFAARKEGLKLFCSTANAFKLGSQGKSYNHVCAENNEAKFLKAYDLGKQRFTQNERVKNLQREVKNLEKNIKSNRSKINKYENSLIKSGTSTAQRQQLLNNIKNLNRDIHNIQIERLFLIGQLYNERQILAKMPNSANF